MLSSLALLELPAPEGDTQFAIASMVVVAVGVLRFAEALLGRYLPSRDRQRAERDDREERDERDRDSLLQRVDNSVEELREWHKPDASGNQTWKNGQVISILKDIRDSLVRREAADRDRRDRDRDNRRD